MAEEVLKGNHRFAVNVKELGYCCAFGFLAVHSKKRHTHQVVAAIASVGKSTIEFNRRKMRNGELSCEGCANCQCKGAK